MVQPFYNSSFFFIYWSTSFHISRCWTISFYFGTTRALRSPSVSSNQLFHSRPRGSFPSEFHSKTAFTVSSMIFLIIRMSNILRITFLLTNRYHASDYMPVLPDITSYVTRRSKKKRYSTTMLTSKYLHWKAEFFGNESRTRASFMVRFMFGILYKILRIVN